MKIPYKSLYPSIDLENNIAPNTQIGKIEIEEKVYNNENRYLNEKYERGGEFIENFVCDNIILFAHRWLHLANFEELMTDLQEYWSMTFPRLSVNDYTTSRYIMIGDKYVTCPFVPVADKVINPFMDVTNGHENPFILYNPMPERN